MPSLEDVVAKHKVKLGVPGTNLVTKGRLKVGLIPGDHR